MSGINDRALLLTSADAARAAEPIALPWIRPRPTEYRIGPSDLLEIEIYELEEPNQSKRIRARVGQSGSILLPLIGGVQAGGTTATELQESIEARLARDFIHNPSVSVLVAEYKSRKVTVLGEVKYPGSFDLDQNSTTLINALALAGGPTSKAGGKVFVLRAPAPGGPEGEVLAAPPSPGSFLDPAPAMVPGQLDIAAELGTHLDQNLDHIDLDDLVVRGNMALNCSLGDGDVIHVPRAPMCFVMGLVHYPGGFPLRDDVTVLKAIALAGGMRDNASPRLTVLIRVTADGRITIPIDLSNVRAGADNDLLLRPGDVLVLSESQGSKVGRSVLEFFRGLFTIGYAVK